MRRSRSGKKTPKPKAAPHWAPLRSARVWMALVWIGAFAAIAYGLNRLEPHVHSINVSPTVIEWADAPEWLRDDSFATVLPGLEARIDLSEDADIYSDRVCAYVGEQLADSAWVGGIRRVTKQQNGHVRIYADFRKPFAMVDSGGFAYLVDERGVRLPLRWDSHSINRQGWFVIEGVSAPPPNPGERWAGGDIAAGLELADFLYKAETAGRMVFRDSIRAIDVGNYNGRRDARAGWLRLVTINPRSYIHWGLAPGEEYGVESSAELKLAKLSKWYRSDGKLPDRGPMDVRYDDAIAFGEPE